MDRAVEKNVETSAGLCIRVLGPVLVSRAGKELTLPRSRKVRALLAFLALGSGPVTRSRLCDLLWDAPNDPRGELRWCLSKLRALLDDEERQRVVSIDNARVALDLRDCVVDALEIDRLAKDGIERLPTESLAALSGQFGGDLLEGIVMDGNPEFTGWLTAQRQRYRTTHVAVLAELVTRSRPGSDERFRRLDAWLELAPFDGRAHELLLETLVTSGRMRDAEEHVASTIRAFEQDGLDGSPVRERWNAIRASAVATPRAVIAEAVAPADPQALAVPAKALRRRASVAVMPFVDRSLTERDRSGLADGLTEDVITRLAKLRVLFVIARGTTFALGERGLGAEEAGRLLKVEYVASGSVRREGARLSVHVELVETETARIVWTEQLDGVADETFSVLDTIVDRIVASIAEEIETAECQRALLKPPSSLDAWEAYHRGLWHMYKFNGPDNREAERYFQDALRLDPAFARAYAGLSFTHFQNSFLDLTPDRDRQIELAFETASRSLDADGRDPAAHWAMGRALWLRGEQQESFGALQRSIELSPNFALGHYTLGFVHSQSGDPRTAIAATNISRQLSPFDPLQFGMLASRAVAHLRLGEVEEAADWAKRATGRPNTHVHILAIAAECLVLANRREEAGKFVAKIRERVPGYSIEDFLRAFRFESETTGLLRHTAKQIGFDGVGAGRSY